MDDDFNTPAALAVLFEVATEVNRSAAPRECGLVAARARLHARHPAAGAARVTCRLVLVPTKRAFRH
jgi:cysteinyl-tRNA synthetase